MTIPAPLLLRSRKMTDLGDYVPAYDGVILRDSEARKDRLVFLAEIGHRVFAHSTNIGMLSFLLELSITFMLEIHMAILREGQDINSKSKKAWARDRLAELNEMFESFEITDECFSTFFAYIKLKEKQDLGNVRRLDDIVNELYPKTVSANYQRLRRLGQGLSIEELAELSELIENAARVDDKSLRAALACDERFEFFLTLAETALRKGVHIRSLNDYCVSAAEKVGYRIAPLYLEWPDIPRNFPLADGRKIRLIDTGTTRDYLVAYEEILRRRRDERSLLISTAKRVLQGTVEVGSQEGNEISKHIDTPSVIALPENGKWTFLCGLDDESSRSKWMTFTSTTILREAILRNWDTCPLSEMSNNGKDWCYPIDKPGCVYSEWKSLFS